MYRSSTDYDHCTRKSLGTGAYMNEAGESQGMRMEGCLGMRLGRVGE